MKNLLLLLLFLPIMAISQDAKRQILTMREFTVKLGHNDQFQEGVKMWKSCYNENGGKNKWDMWRRLQGDNIVYISAGRVDNWAAFDEENPAGDACAHIYRNYILPHIESNSYNLAYTMPEISRKTLMEGRTKVVVHNFRVDNGQEFNLIATELTNTQRKVEGDTRGSWFNLIGGDRDDAHYFASVPYMNYAEMDKQDGGIWMTYEKEHGKVKSDQLRARWRACISDYWSYTYSLNKDLSN